LTPKSKTPFNNKDETLDTPHFENEDTEELKDLQRSDALAKKFSPLEIQLDKEQRSYSP